MDTDQPVYLKTKENKRKQKKTKQQNYRQQQQQQQTNKTVKRWSDTNIILNILYNYGATGIRNLV